MTTLLSKLRQYLLCLIWAHIIIGQNALYSFHTLIDNFFIIRIAVLSKQILQYINWHVSAFFYVLSQIFSDNLAIKELTKLFINYFSVRSFVALKFTGACLIFNFYIFTCTKRVIHIIHRLHLHHYLFVHFPKSRKNILEFCVSIAFAFIARFTRQLPISRIIIAIFLQWNYMIIIHFSTISQNPT